MVANLFIKNISGFPLGVAIDWVLCAFRLVTLVLPTTSLADVLKAEHDPEHFSSSRDQNVPSLSWSPCWTLEEMLGYRGARGRTAGSRCEPLDYFSTVYFFCKNYGYTGHFVTSSKLKNLGWKIDQLELAVKEDRILVMDETGGASRIDGWDLCPLLSFLILGSQATIITLR